MGNNVAMMLAYVTVNTVRDRLDEVMGLIGNVNMKSLGQKLFVILV